MFKLYLVKDSVTDEVRSLVRCVNDADAIRSFRVSLRDLNHESTQYMFARDSVLCRVTDYIEKTGEFISIPIISGAELIDEDTHDTECDHDEDTEVDNAEVC